MAVTYKGVIAGIGDKENDINVINPQFDAEVNDFIVGTNGIISGLELKGTTLTAGMCICNGYRGSLKNDINVGDFKNSPIYGVFNVNHSSKILDNFYVVTAYDFNDNTEYEIGEYVYDIDLSSLSPQIPAQVGDLIVNQKNCILKITAVQSEDGEPIDVYNAEVVRERITVANPGADILHKAGTYYLLLFKNGKANNVLDYPLKAKYSDYSTVVRKTYDGGYLEDGVTAATQEVNDNSDKVATTEYVHNQIQEEIGYVKKEIKIMGVQRNNVAIIGTLILTKKAKYVVAIAVINAPSISSSNTNIQYPYLEENIPQEFLPKNEAAAFIAMPAAFTNSADYIGITYYEGIAYKNVKFDGSLGTDFYATNIDKVNTYSIFGKNFASGWETN